jgi:UDP-N-acetylglucosamine 2-epimerase
VRKLRVVTVVGTRPELIRLSRLIPLLDEICNHRLIHTGQNSDPNLKDVFFRDLKLREPDYYLESDTSSFTRLMADTMIGCEKIFADFRPDAVAILGDTNSAIAALVAERMDIPVYHMEAGNRSFDRNVPEELNRRMIDHISTFNLPYNGYSEANLRSEGIQSRFLLKSGSPMREVLEHYQQGIRGSDVMKRLGLSSQSFILASVHRQENVDSPARLSELLDALVTLQSHFDVRLLVSTHPRTRKNIEKQKLNTASIEFLEPFGFLDYCKLQTEAKVVVSDSGTVSEESALLGFPAITPRDSMERPEALEVGSVVMTGITSEGLVRGAEWAIANKNQSFQLPEGYEVDNFSQRVANFIISTAKLAHSWTGLRRSYDTSQDDK